MRKILLFVLVLFSLFGLNINANAFELPKDEDEILSQYCVISETKNFSIPYVEPYTFVYNKSLIEVLNQKNGVTNFIILTPIDSVNIYVKDANEKVINVYDIKFITPETIHIDIIDGTYYVLDENDNILYGDFTWEVDGKSVIAPNVEGNDVSLKYKGTVYSIKNNDSYFEEYFLLIVGIPLVMFIIGYLIYFTMPMNYYKRIYNICKKIKRNIYKKKTYKSLRTYLRLKILNLTNTISYVEDDVPIWKELNIIRSNLMLTLDNLVKLDIFFPADSNEQLINYFMKNMDELIRLVENGNYKFKSQKSKRKKKFKKIVVTPQMDREQEDAYRYLEKIEVIKKD